MRAVFSLITVIFVVCVSATVTSFKEIPLDELNEQEEFRKMAENERAQDSFDEDLIIFARICNVFNTALLPSGVA